MKVETKPIEFRPVLITVESMQELEGLLEVVNNDLRGVLPQNFLSQLQAARNNLILCR